MGRNVFIINTEDCERYECPFCWLALENPLQLECGDRICKACTETIFNSPVRLETVTHNYYYIGYRATCSQGLKNLDLQLALYPLATC